MYRIFANSSLFFLSAFQHSLHMFFCEACVPGEGVVVVGFKKKINISISVIGPVLLAALDQSFNKAFLWRKEMMPN